MAETTSERAIKRFIGRARKDPFFVGWAFSEYQDMNKLSDKDLARLLECSLEKLDRLALCRLPKDEDKDFQENIKEIADYASCNAEQLLKILREVLSIITIRKTSQVNAPVEYLMAARDRKPEDDDP